jgi:hypothetical protein
MALNRRSFLTSTGLGIGVLSLTGATVLLSPSEARARNIAFKILTTDEVEILEAFAEELLPGSAEAGVAHFVDEQLSRDPNDSLLIARYFQIEPPYSGFYKGGLATLNGFCKQTFGKSFTEMDQVARKDFVGTLFNMGPDGPIDPDGWIGPPATLLYLCVRSDAVDVTYGTVEGFEKLKVPYLAHIVPPEKW